MFLSYKGGGIKEMDRKNKLIVADLGWAETIPEWLLNEVRAERLILGLAGICKDLEDWQKVGDAEVLIYLYTESLKQPLSREHFNIYLYLFNKIMRRRGKEIPEDLKFNRELDRYEEHILRELKYIIYSRRGGDIDHPVLNAMRELKRDVEKIEKVRKDRKMIPLECFR